MAQSPVRLQNEWSNIVDPAGSPIGSGTPGGTLIFEAIKKSPILAPDSHQLSLDEFNAVKGGISTKFTDEGTHTVLRLGKLVPFGVYSIQLLLLGPTGAPVGMGSLDDDQNNSIFTADDFGEADVSVTLKGGALSGNGSVGGCWLADGQNAVMQQPVAQVVGYYHLNGAGGGPAGTFVKQFSFTFSRLMRLPNELRDIHGNPITDSSPPDTPIFEFRHGNAIYAPGTTEPRRQLRLGEYQRACGSIAVKCTTGGTFTAMEFSGLIPHGVYSIWLAKPDPSDMTKMLGVGALGKSDGTENHFAADENGEADIAATTPGGNLSTFGTIANCWPADEPIVQVAGVYHIDGKTHGPVIGPDGTYAAQFAFVFAKPPGH
jgi:hypothetical protein